MGRRKKGKKARSACKQESRAQLASDRDFRVMKANWHRLDRVDRAEIITSIKRRGYSNYDLADLLHVDEGTIRRQQKIADLPTEFKDAIRNGASVASVLKKAKEQKAREEHLVLLRDVDRKTSQSEKLAEEAVSFFRNQAIPSGFAWDVLEEARRQAPSFLGRLSRQGERPASPLKLEDLIRRTEPKKVDWGENLEAFYKPLVWLLNWSCRRYPISEVLDGGFGRAQQVCGSTEIGPAVPRWQWPPFIDRTNVYEERVREGLNERMKWCGVGLEVMMPKNHPALRAARAKATSTLADSNRDKASFRLACFFGQ